jgi:hypothetical protein
VGDPSRASRKGKAGPLETGRGKYSPPASPEKVTSEALSEGTIVFTNEKHIPTNDQLVIKIEVEKPGNSRKYLETPGFLRIPKESPHKIEMRTDREIPR